MSRTKYLYCSKETIADIVTTLASSKSEKGGIIGQNIEGIITNFYYDNNPYFTSVNKYIPNVSELEKIVNEKWLPEKITFSGFVHSHLKDSNPSQNDINFVSKFCRLNNFSSFDLGIVNSNNKQIKFYRILIQDVGNTIILNMVLKTL